MFALPKLTKAVKYILIAQGIGLILSLISPERMIYYFSINTGFLNVQGLGSFFEYISLAWQIFTYPLVYPSGSISLINLLFFGLFMYFVGCRLEESWGTKIFIIFYLTVISVSGLISFIILSLFGLPIVYGISGITFSIIAVYAWFAPNLQFFIFGLFPVKVKWLLLVAVILAIFSWPTGFVMEISAGLVAVIFVFIKFPLPSWVAPYARGMKEWVDDFKYKFKSGNKKRQFKVFTNKKYYHNNASDAEIVDEKDEVPDEYEIKHEVDRILDKISKYGIDTLTKKEKKFLDSVGKDYNSDQK
jgi:membrane associated rhomboid family serine protease